MKRFKVPLFLKLILPVLIGAPLVFAIYLAFSYFSTQQISSQSTDQRAREIAAIVEAHLVTETERLELIAQLAAADNDLLPSAKSKKSINLAKALIMVSPLMTQEQIDVFSAKGVPLQSYSKTPLTKIKPVDLDEKSVKSKSPAMFCSTTEKRLVSSHPILNESTKRIGLVVVSKSLEDVFEDFRELRDAGIALLEPTNRLFFSTEQARFNEIRFPTKKTRASEASYFENNGELILTKPVNLEGQDFLLAIALPTTERNMQIRLALFAQIGWMSLLFLLLIVGSWRWTKHCLRPLHVITKAAESISSGDLLARAEVSTGDEIEELAGAFNWMADRLQLRITQAEEMAIIDSLTGLYNHRYFCQHLEREMERAERYQTTVSILFCDIDNFKEFNDENGHIYGDGALKKMAQLLKASIRSIDTPARYGGEEFAVILPRTSAEGALEVAERLRASVANSHFKTRTNADYTLTLSVGIASYPKDGHSSEELITKADLAMYGAKAAGKNVVRNYIERIAIDIAGKENT